MTHIICELESENVPLAVWGHSALKTKRISHDVYLSSTKPESSAWSSRWAAYKVGGAILAQPSSKRWSAD